VQASGNVTATTPHRARKLDPCPDRLNPQSLDAAHDDDDAIDVDLDRCRLSQCMVLPTAIRHHAGIGDQQ